LRRFLDRLYAATGALGALCLAAIAVVMLLQAGMRAAGFLLRGADDMVAWFCAASAFLALAYTFRHGEHVRVSLLLNGLRGHARRHAETFCLVAALVVSAYATWAICNFVFESWKFGELAQGLIQIPIWIPQLSLVLGALVFSISIADELTGHLRGRPTSYDLAEAARRAQADFSDHL
jgi:TRAP-type C4-dicarboxylate transport system permease small subunit